MGKIQQIITFSLAFLILTFFAFTGTELYSTFFHEVQHAKDYRTNFNIVNDSIQIYILPNDDKYDGTYTWNATNWESRTEEFRVASERRAYFLSYTIISLNFVSVCLILIFLLSAIIQDDRNI